MAKADKSSLVDRAVEAILDGRCNMSLRFYVLEDTNVTRGI